MILLLLIACRLLLFLTCLARPRPAPTTSSDPRCPHCHADCAVDHAHMPDCPTITDVWPVTAVELEARMACEQCCTPFQAGEHYTGLHRVVCLGCAAHHVCEA